MFIHTNTSGIRANAKPSACAFSTRNAWLKRANVNTMPIPITIQNDGGRRRTSAMRIGQPRSAFPLMPSGSCTPTTMRTTANKAGTNAHQNTARKSLA